MCKLKNNVNDSYEEIRTIQNIKADFYEFNQKIEQLQNNLINLKYETSNIYKTLKDTNNYIDKDMPTKVQTQISETLHSCLGRRERRILTEFEDKKFNKLEELYDSISINR